MFSSCFPHVINLACKAVLGAVTDLKHASPNAPDFVPAGASAQTFMDAIDRDPISTVRTLVRVVSPLYPRFMSLGLTIIFTRYVPHRSVANIFQPF